MSDLEHQNLNVAQSDQQPDPRTIASAATIAPTERFSFVSGNTQIDTITPPTSGYCELVLCMTHGAPAAFSVAGNIKTAYQPITDRPFSIYYVKQEDKWYVQTVT